MTNEKIYRYAYITMELEQKKIMDELTNKWIDNKSIRTDLMSKIIELNNEIDEIVKKIEKERNLK